MIERGADDSGQQRAEPARSTSARRIRPAPLVLGIALGVAAAIVAVLLYALATREARTRLTEEAYQAAVERWEAHGPASYELDLELSGNRPGKVHVEVRQRQVVLMTRDGVQPQQERTWYYWSVPGQFDTIAAELEMARDPAGSFDSPEATEMVIWAEFDPRYGYPLKYDRTVLGTDYAIGWKVTRFEPIGPKK